MRDTRMCACIYISADLLYGIAAVKTVKLLLSLILVYSNFRWSIYSQRKILVFKSSLKIFPTQVISINLTLEI